MEALRLLKSFGLSPDGIIHVGANYGQEFEAYQNSGAETVVYVEPISSVFDALKGKVERARGHYAVKAVCSERAGDKVRFNVASNSGASSSILELGNHAKIHPEIVYVKHEEMTTTTVDKIVSEQFNNKLFNLLVIDVQGAELLVLKGAIETLHKVDGVYVEISEAPLYDGGCTWPELEAFLSSFDFRLKHMWIGRNTYGDAFFLKNSAFSFWRHPKLIERSGINVALRKPATQSSLSVYSRPNDAQGAVSGVLNGSYGFHTGKENRPWWQVDLEASFPLEEIVIFNRLDAARERAYFFVVKLASEEGKFREVYAHNGVPFGGIDGTPATIKLDGTVARYVRIELPRDEFLHLDQVEVYSQGGSVGQ
ncbi:FkbM family methyltransferase [Methylocapsa aurea]|uniref:FkbM family methyltransferase n=1 Tax=Methylocapsa aurea TaxID=663610 RepID=UPI00055A6925|nr:FkbM family methyltransferase [Methylocapsa aurea]